MRILTRYVLREFCVPLAYCLTGFISVYVLFELFGSFSRLTEAKPGFIAAVEYFAGYFAPYFQWMAPACLMLATLYTMWNFCRHSELIAMRASGVGFFAIVKPLLAVACLMACFTAWVNEVYVPEKAQWAKRFKDAKFRSDQMQKADDIVFHNPKANRIWKIGRAADARAKTLEEVKVTVDWPGGGRRMTITAPRAEHLDGQWYFSNPEVAYYSQSGEEQNSPVPELEQLSLRTFAGFDESPRDFLMQNRDWAFCSTQDRLRYLERHPSISPETRRDYRYDVWSKLLSPLACLVITLFAIPAGIATGRQSVFRGVVGALGMFFAFYALTILCMILAKRGLLPPVWAAALPHAAFLAVGIHLFRRHR